MLTALLVSALVGSAMAQVPGLGRCPQPPVKPFFKVDRYLGDWYEIERYWPIFFEFGSVCVKATYGDVSPGVISVTNSGQTRSGEPDVAEGRATYADSRVAAKLSVSFGGSSMEGNYWVLDTDYRTYSVVYSCTSLGFLHADIIWILGRERTMSPSKVSKIRARLERLGLRTRYLYPAPQEDCVDN